MLLRLIENLNLEKISFSKKLEENEEPIKVLRLWLNLFMQNLQLEGTAEYFKQERDFDKKTFKKIYSKAEDIASFICNELEPKNIDRRYNSVNKGFLKRALGFFDRSISVNLLKFLQIGPYVIGEHIIYTICYVNPEISIEELFQLGYLKLIKKYEECMDKMKLIPLVSVNSGKGILDYNRLLKNLNNIYRSP